jgi:hypothetical protein
MHPDSVGEIIHRACYEEQSIPDLSLGNQFANIINPRSPCLTALVYQPVRLTAFLSSL